MDRVELLTRIATEVFETGANQGAVAAARQMSFLASMHNLNRIELTHVFDEVKRVAHMWDNPSTKESKHGTYH